MKARRYSVIFFDGETECRFEFTHRLTKSDYQRASDGECVLIDNFTCKVRIRDEWQKFESDKEFTSKVIVRDDRKEMNHAGNNGNR